MQLTFNLMHQVITRLDDNTVVANSHDYLTAKFVPLTNDWTAPVTALFNEYAVILDENMECVVPWEVLTEEGSFSVSAFQGDLHTANTCRVFVEKSGYTEGITPQPPTPDVYTTLTKKITHAENLAQGVRDDADAGKFDGAPGKPGDKGEPGAKGEPGLTKEEHDALINAAARADVYARNQLRNTAKGVVVNVTDAYAPNSPEAIKVHGKTVTTDTGLSCVDSVELVVADESGSENRTVIGLQGNTLCGLLDGTSDVLTRDSTGTWIYKTTICIFVDASRDWKLNGTTSEGATRFQVDIPEASLLGVASWGSNKGLAFPLTWGAKWGDNPANTAYADREGVWVYTNDKSVEDFKANFPKDGITIYAPLKAPECIELTPTPLPVLPAMVSNVWSDTNVPGVETEVTYVQDVNKVIDDLTARVTATQNLLAKGL